MPTNLGDKYIGRKVKITWFALLGIGTTVDVFQLSGNRP